MAQGLSGLSTGGGGSITAGLPLDLRVSHAPPSPPSTLGMIREERQQQQHPQISLTDEQGDEVTLVGPSAPPHNFYCTPLLPNFVVSGPCDPCRPSIVRGIGRQRSTTGCGEVRRDSYARSTTMLRNTFPPLGCENSSDVNVFASELQKTSSGSFEVALSDVCSRLDASDILSIVKRIIDVRAPPSGFAFSCQSDSGGTGDWGATDSGLALEYPGGIQIELRVFGCESKGLKMRRISGDHLQYNQLCQELISFMTV